MVRFSLAILCLLALAGSASAGSVALDIQADQALGKWYVYANVSDCDGLASFYMDVTGSGGASVLTSRIKAPANLEDGVGFSELRNAPASGVGITASQPTMIDPPDPGRLMMNVGVGTPVLLAEGTYSGTVGSLTVAVHEGGYFNVFPAGFLAGDSTEAATVTGDMVFVPEPMTCGLLLAGSLLVVCRRRRQ